MFSRARAPFQKWKPEGLQDASTPRTTVGLQRLRVRRWIYSCSNKVTKTVVAVAEDTCIVYLYASDARHQPLLGPCWAVLSCDTVKYSPRALDSGGTSQIFALNRTSAYRYADSSTESTKLLSPHS